MRTPEAQYDSSLFRQTQNQDEATEAVFNLIQELRKAAADGELTSEEVWGAVFANAPDTVSEVVDLIRDPSHIGADGAKVAFGVYCQLDPFDESGDDPGAS